MATVGEDVIVEGEHAIGLWVEFLALRGAWEDQDRVGTGELTGDVSAGLIHEQHGVDARRNRVRDFREVPRFAQRRVILFFCPTRASSSNQTSIGMPRERAALALSGSATEAPILNASITSASWRGSRGRTKLAIAKRLQLAAQRRLRDRDLETET